jgi:hypothetical protein
MLYAALNFGINLYNDIKEEYIVLHWKTSVIRNVWNVWKRMEACL